MLCILLIDDSKEYQGLLRKILESNYPDIEIVAYDPIKNGIPKKDFNWHDFNVVLLDYDLGLPGETGIDWLADFVRYGNTPPIIMLSAKDDDTLIQRSLEEGAFNYLLKKEINPENIMLKLAESLIKKDQTPMPVSKNINENQEDVLFVEPDDTVVIGEHGEHASGNLDLNRLNPSLVVPGYEILREVGEGAMSVVLLARRLEDGAEVVLKVFFTLGREDTSALRRFMQEYNIISGLKHPNVVCIYERAFASDFAYIAMEYFPAGDLKRRIEKGISPETAMNYLTQIAAGLGVIHDKGIIHRDLKPGNILFRNDDTLTITDFGVAKIITGAANDITVNNSMVIGTPYYMSPEQGTGLKIDKRADIYSLGVIFFQMLTGKRPYIGGTLAQLVSAHINQPIPRLPGHLSKYQALVDGLLAKDPDERFQDINELLVGIDWIS